MNRRGSALTVLMAACTAALAGIAPATADPTRLPSAIDLPCASAALHQNADWYLPDAPPRGLVWLQHGFARSSDNVAALAETLAGDGFLVFAPSLPFMNLAGCTLQNLGDNTPFLDQIAQLFTGTDDPGSPLRQSLATAAARAGRIAPPIPREFVFIGHSAGAEAVEYVAHRLHATYPNTWPGLRGLVLLDPVKSFLGTNTETALTDLDPTGMPILTISGPASLCNNFGSGTTAVQNLLHRNFLGVRLPTGEHTDAEGLSTDDLGALLCGAPQTPNAATVKQLTATWATDFIDGITATATDPTATATPVQLLGGPLG